jgi:glyoxylase-like metal-dependent hydrolase (beta-lactamase superfamily II)
MAVVIPFVRKFDFAYGRSDVVSPGIRRVVAENPGPFTFTGTGTYIVGHGEVAVIDPGPALDAHLAALLRSLERERVKAILVTHHHADHSPLAARLSKLTGAPVYGCAARPIPGALPASGGEEGDDEAFRPDIDLCGGGTVSGPGWTLEAVPTPGHTSNHLCFAYREENALFTGDHIMGWSTSVVIPPDGDMASYLASLQAVRARKFKTLWPTHGPPVTDVDPFLAAYIAHRLEREAQVLAAVQAGVEAIPQIVERLYVGLDARLKPAAAQSVLSHLFKLVAEGRVRTDGPPQLGGRYRP